MKKQRIIPTKTIDLRCRWLEKLGGIKNVSVRNKEWLALLKEDTRNSLMIEGYFVSRAEIIDIIDNPKYTKTAYKVLGYFDAAVASYELAFQQYKTNEFKLTKPIIRQIHSLMFRGDPHFAYAPGEWRKGPVEINGSRVETSSEFKIDDHITKLINIVNNKEENLIRKIAIVHDMFEQIHPFPDGNGRVGRIILNFILVGHGLPNIAIKGSEINKKKYINALEAADLIVAPLLKGKSQKNVFSKPLIELEDLINKSLATAMDIIICNRFNEEKSLMSLDDVAKFLNKSIDSVRVACSQKKHICANVDGMIRTHPDLLQQPK